MWSGFKRVRLYGKENMIDHKQYSWVWSDGCGNYEYTKCTLPDKHLTTGGEWWKGSNANANRIG